MALLSWIPGFQKKPRNRVRVSGPEKEVYKGGKEYRQDHTGLPGPRLFQSTQPKLGFSSLAQMSINTVLQKYLRRGEFPAFKSIAMFESTFVQVTRRGRQVFFHNHGNEAVIGITSTNVKLPLPNLMIIARPVVNQVSWRPPGEELALTRIIPLKFVRLSIHDLEKQLIKIKLINGRSYYLQLHPSTEEKDEQFQRWMTLIYLLHHPPACYLRPKPVSCTVIDNLSVRIMPSDEEAEEPKDSQEAAARAQKAKAETEQEKEEKKETEDGQPVSAKNPGQGGFDKEEEYTSKERQILEEGNVMQVTDWYNFGNPESYEIYQGSATTVKPSRTFSAPPFLSELHFSSTSTSLSSGPPPAPPVFPVPKKGENGSLNIVTIYSDVSNILGEKNGKNKD
ncbi:hypothetical protein JRQ81_005354 [Phrynocephalus forsythii]|uniref:Golgi associated RAB2 interactor protein-like Rab2B-binding domain-containing protein n=1 Tax=Phrynocephalus forsythii TaxID=171643 RepID=A0A9Q0Y2U9_9SAUR|nr:hypothetical protein JRQ81_005354 [Phrynocephalus forsythii]